MGYLPLGAFKECRGRNEKQGNIFLGIYKGLFSKGRNITNSLSSPPSSSCPWYKPQPSPSLCKKHYFINPSSPTYPPSLANLAPLKWFEPPGFNHGPTSQHPLHISQHHMWTYHITWSEYLHTYICRWCEEIILFDQLNPFTYRLLSLRTLTHLFPLTNILYRMVCPPITYPCSIVKNN